MSRVLSSPIERVGFVALVGIVATTLGLLSCNKESPTEPSPDCTATVAPMAVDAPATSSTTQVGIAVNAACAWTALSAAEWIAVAPGSGIGPGSVALTITTNLGENSRQGSAVVAGRTVSVTQAGRTPSPPCSYTIDPESASFDAPGGTGRIAVTTAGTCAWTAASEADWVTITSGATQTGPGGVDYAVAANPASTTRVASVTIAGRTAVIVQAGEPPIPGCTYGVSPETLSFGAAGGSGRVTVTTTANCAWTAVSPSDWVTITAGGKGTGGGVVDVAVGANHNSESRAVSLTIAGRTVAVFQAGEPPAVCSYTTAPDRASFGAGGGSGAIAVETAGGCAWTASSGAPWITIRSGASGNGPGTVNYDVATNPSATSRTAIVLAGGRVTTITQAGEPSACQYSVAPVQLTACMAATSYSVSITTQDSCTWSVSASDGFMSVVPQSGLGGGSVQVGLSSNYDAPRSGTVMVRWPTPTAGQNVHVDQAGCRYGVSPAQFTVSSAAAGYTFEVVQESDPINCGGPLQNGCIWSAIPSASWIAVTTPMPQKGDGRVSFTVQANTGQSRTATIVVRDKVVTVTQAGR